MRDRGLDRALVEDEPHLCLRECAWHTEVRAATEQHFAVSLRSGEVARYVSTTRAYSDTEYTALLHRAGFATVERHASLAGDPVEGGQGLFVLIARAK